MTALEAPSLATESESAVLERIRHAYEGRGYEFRVHPPQELLPAALRTHKPDALATKRGENIIIEVKSRRTKASEMLASYTKHLIASEPGWKLDIVYATAANPLTIPTAEAEAIRQQIEEVETLTKMGHDRAAFILSWSLLEAALNQVNGSKINKAREPGQVVQSLALLGYLETDAERTLRGLADLRNRVAHGDLASHVSTDDVNHVLDAVRGAMAAT